MNDTRRKITSFLLATTIIFCGSTLYYAFQTNRATNAVTDNYQQSLNQLLESIASINSTLTKVKYSADTALLTTLAANVWAKSESAKTAMSNLPLTDYSLEQCETFISQAGDYAYYLMRSNTYSLYNEKDWSTFSDLADTAASLYTQLNRIKEQADVGIISFDTNHESSNETISGSFHQIESEFPEYAKLIYDGPFSEHIQSQTPMFLKDKPVITESDARLAAAETLGLHTKDLTFAYSTEGKIPTYVFSAGSSNIAITKTGGYLLSILDNRQPNNTKISEEDAVAYAKQFLLRLGYENMESTYYLEYESVITVNFAYTQNDTIYYPDLVQVGIALDSGAVVRFDATGYLMNHQKRDFKSPAVAITTASSVIPKNVAIQSQTLAVIPTNGQMEKLCYAFTCEHEDGQKLLYYVNAQTGLTENLFILVDTGHGTLTM